MERGRYSAYRGLRREALLGSWKSRVGALLTAAAIVGSCSVATVRYQEHQNRVATSAWQAQILDRLEGRVPLSDEEVRYAQMQVIASGKTLRERRQMEAEGLPVNVRNYPATNYPNGRPTEVVGKFPQGAVIEDAIVVDGSPPGTAWGVFKCHPQVSLKREKRDTQTADAVCTTRADFLKPIEDQRRR